MKHVKYLLLIAIVLLGLNSCTRTYTSATSIVPSAQAPISHKEKGDLSVKASYEFHDAREEIDFLSIYHFLPVSGVDFDVHGAITDNMSVGFGYQASFDKPYVGHTFSPSFNYFKNYESKKKATYGFDVLAGIDITTAKNYMEVDEYFHNLYIDDESVINYDYDFHELGYYKIDENAIRVFAQPSFTVENEIVEFHIATNLGIRSNIKYQPQLEIVHDAFIEDQSVLNPMVYYQQNKTFFTGESFVGLGLGPEICRIITYTGLGYGTDDLQKTYWFGSIGVRSNFSVLKKKDKI